MVLQGLFSATQTEDVKHLIRAGLRNPTSVEVAVSDASGRLVQEMKVPSTLRNEVMVSVLMQYTENIYKVFTFSLFLSFFFFPCKLLIVLSSYLNIFLHRYCLVEERLVLSRFFFVNEISYNYF